MDENGNIEVLHWKLAIKELNKKSLKKINKHYKMNIMTKMGHPYVLNK